MTKKALHILAEYAPGIPSKVIKELPRISEPQPMQLAIQKHDAKRAGTHYDVRIVDEKSGKAYSWAVRNLPSSPGDKALAVLQPTHTANYSTWSGTIESGYGAGEVNLFSHDKIEVIKAEPSKITFNVYKSNGDTERYAMINTGGDDWLFHNVTPTRITRPEVPEKKPSYKGVAPSSLDPTNENEVWAPKVDGALNVFVLKPDKPIETYSYRPSAKGKNKLIDHTFRMGLHRTIVPTAFKGKTVLMGEVFAKDRGTGKVLPSSETSARLLSNVWRSRELQENAPLDNMVFNVLRYNGRDVSNKPYSEKLKILKQITSAVPQLKMPPLHATSESKQNLLKEVIGKEHPLTEEGVVVYKMDEHVPTKAKLQQDYDVYVRGVFPGKGKYKNSAGGFTYSFKPSGPLTGRVGSGLSDSMRQELKNNPSQYTGSVARIFAQQQLPSGALRMPVFKDMRAEKFAAVNMKNMATEYILPSLVAGPIIGAGVTAATAKNKKEFKQDVGKGIKAGIVADVATGAALGLWGQRKKLMKVAEAFTKLAYPPAAEPVTGYPISTTNLHEIGKTQGEEMPDTNVQVAETRKFLRRKMEKRADGPSRTGDIYLEDAPKTNNYYQDTSAYRITEHLPDSPSSVSPAMTATVTKNGRKVRVPVSKS